MMRGARTTKPSAFGADTTRDPQAMIDRREAPARSSTDPLRGRDRTPRAVVLTRGYAVVIGTPVRSSSDPRSVVIGPPCGRDRTPRAVVLNRSFTSGHLRTGSGDGAAIALL